MTTKKLTPPAKKAYIGSGGVRCPFCGSDAIEGGFISTDAGIAWQRIKCLKCGEAWVDHYKLVDIAPR